MGFGKMDSHVRVNDMRESDKNVRGITDRNVSVTGQGKWIPVFTGMT